MLYSIFSGITIYHNKLVCVVLKSGNTGWRIQRCFTYPVQNKQDWQFAGAELHKHLPKWRNCVAISLGFEEVLSKSSVINASLSLDEELSYVKELLSQVSGEAPLAYDYKRRVCTNTEDEINLYICKKETLDTLLCLPNLAVDVVGWRLTDLYVLSQELLSKIETATHYFIDLTAEYGVVACLDRRCDCMFFDVRAESFAELVLGFCLGHIPPSSVNNDTKIGVLVFGLEPEVLKLTNGLAHLPNLRCIHAAQYVHCHASLSFSDTYPALACALGAKYWREGIE
ncbi:hypothetical protein [Vibrio rarus]|uniref:hypothetical protein n=1 Tax=Vibrio rarus TaxID=413403 RepID=UPI0021C3EA21|nr:hypothetical protein [Vibrio rarus]